MCWRTDGYLVAEYGSPDAVVMGGEDPALISMAGVDLHDYPRLNGGSCSDWFCQQSLPLSDHVNEVFLTKRKRDGDYNSEVH